MVGGLVITADSQKTQLPDGWTEETWSGIYAWLVKQPRSTWSTELIHFFEVLETQMVNDKSIGDRALTRFDGIPFDDGHPYSYSEAKRLIRLLGSKISNDKRLCRTLDIVHGAEGRAAITDGPAVWDYFSLRKHPKGKTFTFYPHMTFSIRLGLRKHFEEQDWELWDEAWLHDRLHEMAAGGYENQVSAVVAKMLVRWKPKH